MAAMPMFFEIFFRESLNDFIPGAGLGVASFDDYDPDLKLLLFIVGDIMKRTVSSSTSDISSEPESSLKTQENQNRLTSIMQRYASTITSTSRELTCKLGEKEYDKTSRIMKTLSTYSWKTMATLALAAFAIKFGKLRLLTLLCATNPLARTVVLLKQQPEYTQYLKSWFDTLASLINKTLELAEQILQYKERVQQQISPEKGYVNVKKTDYTIPTAAYWTVNSVVVCSSQIMDVLVMRKCTYTDLAACKVNLDNLTEKLKSMVERLSSPPQESTDKVALYPVPTENAIRLKCLQNLCLTTAPEVESDRHSMPYKSISLKPESHVFSSTHKDEKCYTDIHEELVCLLAQKNLPLLDGSTKNRVSIDVLKSKMLLLFISDLDLLPEELLILKKVFMDSRQHSLENRFEIIWIPVLDKHKMHRFETIQSWMPWYSIYHPLLINPTVINYIKEMWQFNGKPLIVVLDSEGNVINHNAIHMIRVWGSQAIPFTKVKEEMLWKTVNWRIEFLVDSIDPLISGLIEDGKYLCLYGGRDKEWIQRFTNAAQKITHMTNIQLAMVYMGNSCVNGIIESNINTVVSQNSSHKFFWLRLESMVRSRECLTDSAEMFTVLEEIKTLLDYDKKGKSWAMIGQKDSMMIIDKANGKEFLKGFLEYDQWKENAEKMGFLPALTSYIHELETKPNKNQVLKTKSSSRRDSRNNTRLSLKSFICFAGTPTN